VVRQGRLIQRFDATGARIDDHEHRADRESKTVVSVDDDGQVWVPALDGISVLRPGPGGWTLEREVVGAEAQQIALAPDPDGVTVFHSNVVRLGHPSPYISRIRLPLPSRSVLD